MEPAAAAYRSLHDFTSKDERIANSTPQNKKSLMSAAGAAVGNMDGLGGGSKTEPGISD